MPLWCLHSQVRKLPEGLEFMLTDGEQQVPLFVSSEWLAAEYDSARDHNGNGAMMAFDSDRLIAIASEKYAAGEVSAKGIVMIELADFPRFNRLWEER